jgi:hypothetical protein
LFQIGLQKYTRVPVYEGTRDNVKKVLLVKGLLQVEPSPKSTIAELSGLLLIDVNLIDEDTKLDEVLQHFESGTKGHLAVVVGKEDGLQQNKKVHTIYELHSFTDRCPVAAFCRRETFVCQYPRHVLFFFACAGSWNHQSGRHSGGVTARGNLRRNGQYLSHAEADMSCSI